MPSPGHLAQPHTYIWTLGISISFMRATLGIEPEVFIQARKAAVGDEQTGGGRGRLDFPALSLQRVAEALRLGVAVKRNF